MEVAHPSTLKRPVVPPAVSPVVPPAVSPVVPPAVSPVVPPVAPRVDPAEASYPPYGRTVPQVCPEGFFDRLAAVQAPARAVLPRPCDPCTDALADLRANDDTASVVVYVHTSQHNVDRRYWHSVRTWIREAVAHDIAVVPYMSNASAASLRALATEHRGETYTAGEDGAALAPPQVACLWDNMLEGRVFELDAPDSYPPYKLRTASMKMFGTTKRRFPSAKFVVHVDDDTYVRVAALVAYLQGLDPTEKLIRGRVEVHEKRHVSAYCGGPMIMYTIPVVETLVSFDGYACLDEYWKIAPTVSHSDDVFMGFCLHKAAGVVCENGGYRDIVRAALPNDPWFQHMMGDASGCTMGLHKFEGVCFEAQQDGSILTSCNTKASLGRQCASPT